MKRLLTLFAFVTMAIGAFAIPARPGTTKTVTDVNGKTITIALRGDEAFHFYTAADGTPMHELSSGRWEVDTRDVRALWQEALQKRNAQRMAMAESVHRAMKAPARVGTSVDTKGKKKGLLILVNFKDTQMKSTSTQAVFERMMNGLNNPYGQNHGSVREYFRAQSYGEFDIEFDVVGPVTLSQNMVYYGGNDSYDQDLRPGQMVKEACQLVDSEVNFKDYDWDGDGTVENIYVTYAGYAESNGASSNTIWPHQWDLRSATGSTLRLDGVTINTYACGSELTGKSGSTISGIGTMCHEYSHCLGLPDFYDTQYNGHPDMLGWSLMASGSYNADGFCPAGYTAYERWFSGWLEPKELSDGYTVTGMKPIEDEPEAYIVYNDKNRNEYYMLANHQQKGWDISAAGHGMMVLHVDYSSSAWTNNTVNDTNGHQRMIVIPAGGSFYSQQNYMGETYYYATSNDLWPGSTKKTALTDTSTPQASLYNANTDGTKLMHKPIEEITEKNGLISFIFMGGTPIETPVLAEATEVTPHAFRASWNRVDNAVSYTLRLTEKPHVDHTALNALAVYEDFDGFRSALSNTSGDYVKLTAEPADWAGQYLIVYEAGNKAMNGGKTSGMDAANNYVSVSISNGVIAHTEAAEAASFTIAPSGSGYSLQGKGGLYIGRTSNLNGLNTSSTTAYANTLAIGSDGSASIQSSSCYLRFNNGSTEQRFRYYRSNSYTNQQPVALYKAQPGGDDVDLSGKLDDYTFISGWTGENVFPNEKGALLGTEDAIGYLTTPVYKGNTTGKLTIYVEAEAYEEETSILEVTILNEMGNKLTSRTLNLAKENAPITISKGIPANYQVQFSTTSNGKRAYLSQVLIFDEVVTTAQIADMYKTVEDVVTTHTGITETEYVFSGLTPETGYTVEVQAVNRDGKTSDWSAPVSLTTPALVPGDVNNDMELTIADVTFLVNIILGREKATEQADVNGDGAVTIADVTALVNLILGGK